MDRRDWRMRADMLHILATMPPDIVQAEPRYQQRVFHSGDFLITHDQHPEETTRAMPLWNLDGVDWLDAPPPPRWHRHWAQTVGLLHSGEEIWRCPCAAHGAPGKPWIHMIRTEARRAPRPVRWSWRHEKDVEA